MSLELRPSPAWAAWTSRLPPYTVGAEEEIMLLHPGDWSLAQEIERVLFELPEDLAEHVTAETQSSVLELRTGVHSSPSGVASELRELRRALAARLDGIGLRAASAGTHPFTVWQETVVADGARHQAVYGSMRELARREPTFALHVHVGVPDPEHAIRLVNRLRAHLPLLLALSANSPIWQGRDTGLASARTPLFQAFPRVGIPRSFHDYSDWAQTVDLLIRCDAFPEATFLWWDVRPQPRLGTVEVRIMDAQTRVSDTAALVALVSCLAWLEIEDELAPASLVHSPEVLDENRFLAARDGMDAQLVDPDLGRRVAVRAQLEQVLEACRSHAAALGCERELEGVRELAECPGAERQLRIARGEDRLPGLVRALAEDFLRDRGDLAR